MDKNNEHDILNADFGENFEEYSNFEDKEIVNEAIIKDEHIVKKSKKGIVVTIVLIIILAASAFVIFSCFHSDNNINTIGDVYLENIKKDKKIRDKSENTEIYNNLGYENVTGKTIGAWCGENNISFDEFVEDYGLPENITEDTYYDVAVYMMPVAIKAAIDGTDYATIKEKFEIPDEISIIVTSNSLADKIKALFVGEQYKVMKIEVTEHTPWGLIYDDLPIKNCIDENFEIFKFEYSMGDNITPETKMREVRRIMEKVQLEEKNKTDVSTVQDTAQTAEETAAEDIAAVN